MSERVVFLDRDGVINVCAPKHDYVKSWEEFRFLPDAAEAIRKLNRFGFRVMVVTNQRGIARGLMSQEDVDEIHQKMNEELEKKGAHIDAVFVCPHEEGVCDCRKPGIGLFRQAERLFSIDKDRSFMIGDSKSDVLAGRAYGLKTIAVHAMKIGADLEFECLGDAAEHVIGESNR